MGRLDDLSELDTDIKLVNILFKDGRDRVSLDTSSTKNPGCPFPESSW